MVNTGAQMRMFYIALIFLSPPTYSYCFKEAGKMYNVDSVLLEAIATQESSLNAAAVNENKNKDGKVISKDYGLMQINSEWFGKLSDFDVNESTVMEPCFNVHLGAWVLSSNFSTHGYNWNSVGAYNAGFKKSKQKLRDINIKRIKRIYYRLKQRNNL